MSPFEETFVKIKFLLNYYGFSISVNEKKKIIYRWVFVLNVFWLHSDTLGGIMMVFDSLIRDDGFADVTYMTPCLTLTLLSTVKAIIFTYYEKIICDLVTDLRELDREYNRNPPITQSDIYFIHTIIKASKILNVILWSIFSFSPIIVSLVLFLRSGVFEVIFPFLIKYPFDPNDSRIWPFVYIHQLGSITIVLLNIQGPDYCLYICCTYLRIQFRLLRYDLRKTIDDNCFLSHKCFERKCIPLIKWHQKLIEIASKLEYVYTKSTLTHFLSASFLICLTGFNVVETSDPVMTMMFLVFLSANLAQIFLLCYLGDQLMKSTMEVSEAVYNTHWYDVDLRGRKNLLLIHLRAQKPCKLTAFGFSDVNLKSFTSILSTAWSYFALLKSVSSPNKT